MSPEQQIERREDLIGQPAIIVPDLILRANPNISKIQLSVNHERKLHTREDPACFDADPVKIINKLGIVDDRHAWLLFIRYRGLTAKDAEAAKNRMIPKAIGWGYFIGDQDSLSFVGSVPKIEQEWFAVIGRTLADSDVDHEYMGQQIVYKRGGLTLQDRHKRHFPQIVAAVGI